MTRYAEAQALVSLLLEDVRLKPPHQWQNFVNPMPGYDYAHGVREFTKHVEEEDMPAFLKAMYKLNNATVMVPDPPQKWCLKMPLNYGIYGEGDEGKSVMGKKEAKVPDSQVVDNPVMTPQENARWRRGL